MGEYGEPWASKNDGIFDEDGSFFADYWVDGLAERTVACVNALSGVPDEHLPTIMQEVRAVLGGLIGDELSGESDPACGEQDTLRIYVTWGDLRKARALLAKLTPTD